MVFSDLWDIHPQIGAKWAKLGAGLFVVISIRAQMMKYGIREKNYNTFL